jgi:hypothetical protein
MRDKTIRQAAANPGRPPRTEVVAYTCAQVFGERRPILLVSRAGGDWQCLCGGYHTAREVPVMVALDELLEADPSLAQLLDLPDDWEAERASVNDPWIRTRTIADG